MSFVVGRRVFVLAENKVFSTLDQRNGFWHLKLDGESSHLTIFTTSFRWYRWKLLPFGITPAPQIFQKAVYDKISDLEGVLNKSDDIPVLGREKTMENVTAGQKESTRGSYRDAGNGENI